VRTSNNDKREKQKNQKPRVYSKNRLKITKPIHRKKGTEEMPAKNSQQRPYTLRLNKSWGA